MTQLSKWLTAVKGTVRLGNTAENVRLNGVARAQGPSDAVPYEQAVKVDFDGATQSSSYTYSGYNKFNAVLENSGATASAINATATATAAQVKTGLITSTSVAAVAITLPTATELSTALGAVKGAAFEFYVDNTAGANTVTVVVGTGIVAAAPVITGGATLTVAASATQGIGIFRIVFSSATAAVLFRIG